jgi:hypothetical protein
MDSNDDQIDEKKLTELDEEVSNYLEMENQNVKAKESKTNVYNSYVNNPMNMNKNFTKYKEDLYYESKLDTCPSMNNYTNRMNTEGRFNSYPNENNINMNTSQTNNLGIYENLLFLKEKNNSLQQKLQEMMVVRAEADEKSRRFAEIESMNLTLKEEN